MDRRELLGAGLAATAGWTFNIANAFGATPSRPIAASLREEPEDPVGMHEEAVAFQRLAGEIVRFARRAEPHAKDIIASAVQVPALTMPHKICVATPDWARALPEPAIEPLLDSFRRGVMPLARLLQALWEPVPGWECVSRAQLPPQLRPARLLTPSFLFDIDDPSLFNGYTLALAVWQMVHGLRTEHTHCRREVEKQFRAAAGGEVAAKRVFRHCPVQAYAELRGYALEMFAWTVSAGYITVQPEAG